MTRRSLIVAAAVAFAVGMSPLAAAVSANDAQCRIPFSFVVGRTTLPPGQYGLTMHSSGLLIRGADRAAFVLSNRMESPKAKDPHFVFEKRGDTYTLIEVWMGGSMGREVVRPRADRERYEAGTSHPIERVVIPVM